MALPGFTLIFLSVVVAVCVAYVIFTSTKRQRLIDNIPCPPYKPLIGHALMLETDNAKFYKQVMDFFEQFKHLRIFKILLGPSALVILFKPESVEKLLSSSRLITKSFVYNFLHQWLGTGLLTSTGRKWQKRRKMLTPTFHFRILRDFLHVYNEQADVFVRNLDHYIDAGEFDVFPMVTHCALDIICETAMGQHVNAQGDGDSSYIKSVYSMSDCILQRQKKPWLWPDFLFRLSKNGMEHASSMRLLHEFTEKVIRERHSELKEIWREDASSAALTMSDLVSDNQTNSQAPAKRMAFLDFLLYMSKDDPTFTHADIREEVDTFMFEGHDTTAAAMAWAIYLVGSHPDVQEKLHREMDEVFGDSARAIEYEDLQRLKYLECVIKETLRLYPSVPFFARELTEDTVFEGYPVPKGAQAIVLTSALHRNEDMFPNPNMFDPERFTPEQSHGRHPYAYVPFSAGPRNCIGQKFALNEEKVVLASLFRHYRVESVQKTEDMEPSSELILRPKHGVKIKLFHKNK